MKKAIIVHGWGGNTTESWFPWLKKELEAREFNVEVPAMPDSENPKIHSWVGKLKEIVKLDNDIYLIGHSIGCQTILRYLEQLEEGQKIKSAILVAPWLDINKDNLEEEEYEIVEQWVETKIDLDKVKEKSENFAIIYSSNDPYAISTDMPILKDKLNAKEINLGNKEHLNQDAGVYEIPEIIKIMEGIK